MGQGDMDQVEKFIAKHPTLYHMAEAGSWDNIRKHGLLSVAALLDRFEIKGKQRYELFSQWRPKSVPVEHPSFGVAVVRDQHPMPPDKLKKVLEEGLSPVEWYEILNRKCFFWADEERLNRMLGTYKENEQDVITLDTRALVERDLERVTVSHINSGFALRPVAIRGKGTFHHLQVCGRAGRKTGIAELVVDGEVPNIEELAISVQARKGSETIRNIWPC